MERELGEREGEERKARGTRNSGGIEERKGRGGTIKEGAIIGLNRKLNLEKCPEIYKTDSN